jgi:hypothetical protein
MKELMIHVEQIVRPVRAFAPRKLRMRRELLTHVQAALEEERGREGDEAAAVERATARLGEPSEMTRGLQESVPWGERMLMAKLPIPRVLEQMEKGGGRWWRLDWPMTPMQAAIVVVGAGIVPFVALIGLATSLKLDREAAVRNFFERPLIWVLFNLANIALVFATITICSRFMIATASMVKPLRSRAAMGYAGAILLLPVISMLVMVGCLSRRAATSTEFLDSFGVGFFLLMAQALTARLVVTMRRPYAEWLTLEVAA